MPFVNALRMLSDEGLTSYPTTTVLAEKYDAIPTAILKATSSFNSEGILPLTS